MSPIKYILTKHAKLRLVERSIAKQVLEESLQSPTKIEYYNGKLMYKKLYQRGNKKRLLMIVATKDYDQLRIITIIDTSKIQKYL